jgi:hypothetical protein
MIEIGEYDKAEKMCNEQIRRNIHDTFDFPYQQCLRDIYHITGRTDAYRKIATKLLLDQFTIKDYHILMNMTGDAKERKAFSKKAFEAALHQAFRNNADAKDFCFKMISEDGSYGNIRELLFQIPECYPQIVEFFDRMVDEEGSFVFLNALFTRNDGKQRGFIPTDPSADAEVMNALYWKVVDRYGLKTLKKVLTSAEQKKHFFDLNRFANYVQFQLKNS